MNGFVIALKKYAVFSGRSTRMEYWNFFAGSLLVLLVAEVIDHSNGLVDTETGLGLFSSLWSVALFVPSLSAAVRRLHDSGHSGWWLLISLVPLMGLAVIVLLLWKGDPGVNRFGANPLGPHSPIQQQALQSASAE